MSAQSLSIVHQQFTLSSFSASEWQYWLLFYLIPVLHGVLSTPYYLHFCALVCGIALLFGDKITENELVKAEVLLFEFCRHAGDLYGNHACLQCRYQVTTSVHTCRTKNADNECASASPPCVSCKELGTSLVFLLFWL